MTTKGARSLDIWIEIPAAIAYLAIAWWVIANTSEEEEDARAEDEGG